MKKRLISLVLCLALLFTFLPSAVLADEELSAESVTTADLQKAISSITAATEKLAELQDEISSGQQIASTFAEMMKYVGYASTALTAINGSVNFLKLIGVIKDPSSKIGSILDTLRVVNQRMDEMDAKLDNLVDGMTAIQASAEFNARSEKARDLRTAWSSFESNYMENKMDSLMSEFDGMVLNGIKRWCANADGNGHKDNGTDNSSLTVLYVTGEDGKETVKLFAKNDIPEDLKASGKYVTLKEELIPETVDFRIDSYQTDIAAALAANMKSALEEENYEAFTSQNFPVFTGEAPLDEEILNQVAADAVSELVYRISCTEVNRDSRFTNAVADAFTNYCAHLTAPGEGVDAMINSIYLTHALESEVKEDLPDFLNRMLLKTGVYGTFLMDIMGMSDTARDSVKLGTAGSFCKATDDLQDALDFCLTGNDRYCYLINAELRYSRAIFSVETTVHTENIYNDKENYLGYTTEPISVDVAAIQKEKISQVGDVNGLLLFYTLQSNGVTDIHDYLLKNAGAYLNVRDLGGIVTSFSEPKNMPLDGNIKLKSINIIGDDYAGDRVVTLTSDEDDYPDDADPEYIYNNKKLTGTVYNPASGKLESNKVLLASAVYGQTHSYWFYDEAAFFAGPADSKNFTSSMERSSSGKFDHYDTGYAQNDYNIIVSIPLDPKLKVNDGYDPLTSYLKLCEELGGGEEPTGPDPSGPDPSGPKSPQTGLDITPAEGGTGLSSQKEGTVLLAGNPSLMTEKQSNGGLYALSAILIFTAGACACRLCKKKKAE